MTGRLAQTKYQDGTTEVASYDGNGNRISSRDRGGQTTQFAYDKVNRLVTTTFVYDATGNQTSVVDANNRTTQFLYDVANRRTKVIFPDNNFETTGYDALGRVTSRTDANGNSTQYGYDKLGRLVSVTDALGQVTSYTYDEVGNRLTQTDANQHTTSYAYDQRGRRVARTLPLGQSEAYTYDANGNLATRTDFNGRTTVLAYDTNNRLLSKTADAFFVQNHIGAAAVSFTYDSFGNRATMTDASGMTQYVYDARHRLFSKRIFANNQVQGFQYSFDAAGNVTQLGAGTETVNYAYDNLYRLTAETIAGDSNNVNGAVSYTYDPVGNRTQKVSTLPGFPGGLTNYNANDQLSTDTYDANGNTTASGANAGTNGYAYDFENRLVQQGGISIVYDGDGNRVSKTVAGVTTTYLVDTQNPTGFAQVVQEKNTQSGVVNYVYGLELISEQRTINSSLATRYYIFDGHGSVRALTDANGAVTDTYDYDAFGNLIHQTGSTPNNYLYSGEQFDPDLNLYYNRARYLNVSTGRFWTADFFEGDPQSPSSLHKYLYSSDDPGNRRDPSCRFDVNEALTAAYVAVTNFAASVPYLLPALGYSFAALNIGLFIANEDFRIIVAANPDIAHALYEDVALVFEGGSSGAQAIFTAARGATTRRAILDLGGGAVSQIAGAVNIDRIAVSGIKGDYTDIARYFVPEKFDIVVANGPRDDVFTAASYALKSGGRLYINATESNPFARIPDEGTLNSLRLRPLQEAGPLDPQFSGLTFRATNGDQIPTNLVRTTVLEKF